MTMVWLTIYDIFWCACENHPGWAQIKSIKILLETFTVFSITLTVDALKKERKIFQKFSFELTSECHIWALLANYMYDRQRICDVKLEHTLCWLQVNSNQHRWNTSRWINSSTSLLSEPAPSYAASTSLDFWGEAVKQRHPSAHIYG